MVVDELIADAAGFICVLDELRPLDPAAYNPFYDVWTRIAKIPPAERHSSGVAPLPAPPRLLDELEPGSLRNLWKASMARYVLDERRSLELFSDTSVWDDYPGEPGQVFVYEGRCERYELDGAGATLQVDRERQEALQGPPSAASAPWLRPLPTSFEMPVTRFTQLFFVPPGDWSARAAAAGWGGGDGRAEPGEPLPPPPVYSRVVLPFVGPLDRWWEAIYCRLQVELTLTPVSRDAGADLLLLYPEDPEAGGEGEGGPGGWALRAPDCLPPGRLWPAPDPAAHSWSPLSGGPRDYMRVAGPGVYVGCAYRQGPRPGEYREEDCVYFAIARKA
uniref:Uncharacterized protein n=1 Tax=Yamagishiella unicocca TaxID=51707 RepID=A0A2Z5X8B8_9CHLO|nr:hypothetical protein, homolog of Volvox carteri MT0045 [Yamagishiella unicocca]